jgi:hypothetical protein
MSVGIEVMPAAAARDCSASVSTFANTTSSCFVEAASNTGANWRHGPHHSAQKSTNTMSLPSMVSGKLASVISIVAML